MSRSVGYLLLMLVLQPSVAWSAGPAVPSSATIPGHAASKKVESDTEIRVQSRGSKTIVFTHSNTIGVAAFRWEGQAMIVFDHRAEIDLAELQRVPEYQDMTALYGFNTTVLSFPMATTDTALLIPSQGGWSFTMVASGQDGATTSPFVPVARDKLAVDRPGAAVSIVNPSTGQLLLVGTARMPFGSVPQMAITQHTSEFAVIPTWLGVSVEPFSDHVNLRATAEGFTISSALQSPETHASHNVAITSILGLRLSEADLSRPAILATQLSAQISTAATTLPRARSGPRFAVAQSLALMGLGAEAQAILALIALDDPVYALQADFSGLSGIAAILAKRLDEAGGIDDVRLNEMNEAKLWRGIRDAWQGSDASTIRSLPDLLPVVRTYPPELQSRIVPTILETAAKQARPNIEMSMILPSDHEMSYAYPLALQKESSGDIDAALKQLDEISQSQDLLLTLKAGRQAAELRFTSGRVNAASTAEALRRQLFSWRGDERELTLRLRIAELQATAGLWRPALESLRDAGSATQSNATLNLTALIRGRVAGVFRAMLADTNQRPSSIDFVSLTTEFADQFLEGDDSLAVKSFLVENLISLDLVEPARGATRSLMSTMASGLKRAKLGAHLAEMMVENGDGESARATLAQSDAENLPQQTRERRVLILARAQTLRN